MKQMYNEREIKLVNGYGHEDEVFDKTLLATLPNGVALPYKKDSNSQERQKRIKAHAKTLIAPNRIDIKAKHSHSSSHKRHVDKSLTSRWHHCDAAGVSHF